MQEVGERYDVIKAATDAKRGPKESSEEDDKPMLPPPAPAPERKSLLGSLFGGGKK